jgi:hypothetical protein
MRRPESIRSPESIREYGEPGGIFLWYTLDLSRSLYVVFNEDGEELFAHPWETMAADYCESMIERGA